MKTLLLVVGGIWLYSELIKNQGGGGPGPTASAPATGASVVETILTGLIHDPVGPTPSGGGNDSGQTVIGYQNQLPNNSPNYHPWMLPFGSAF